jgi:diguanylate cyclase (GGDEF)-like protein/PAS domain S-box-containing protein
MDKPFFESLSHYIDMLLDAICVVDSEGHFLYVSAGGERVFGYTAEEMLGRQMLDMVHPDDRDKTLKTVADIMAGQAKVDFENRYIRKDGSIVHLLWSARWSEDNSIRIAVARDISKIKQAEATQTALLQISEAAHTEASLPDLYIRIHQIIADLLPISQFVIGLGNKNNSAIDLVYSCLRTRQVGESARLIELCDLVGTQGRSLTQADLAKHHFPEDWLATPLKSQNGIAGALMVKTSAADKIYRFDELELLEFVSDQIAAAIERRKMLESLHQLAMYDQLTGLPNRRLFHDRLQLTLARAKRNEERFAILYLDLDNFKQANDRFGHELGDELLCETSRRLQDCLRESDTVARIGGDEFVIILDQLPESGWASDVADKVQQALLPEYQLGEVSLAVSASIGIAVYPDDGESASTLLQQADINMYRAKQAARRYSHN